MNREQRDIARGIAWTLAAKFAALIALWLLFFRGSHS
jgi:hypothetical protein